MKTRSQIKTRSLILAVGLTLLIPSILCSFPPAPHHLIYGQIRDEMGEPISIAGARVILETTNSSSLLVPINPSVAPGLNYEIQVPMDAGIKPDIYKNTAMTTDALFRLRVVIGNTVYLPIEMIGDLSTLGRPAGKTRIDLTLGEDLDGDGLPDAWERALIIALGGGLTLGDILPGGDSDADGMTNLAEYMAGTYAFDPSDGLFLNVTQIDDQSSMMEFLAIRGRNYSIYASTDLLEWSQVPFAILPLDVSSPLMQSYSASDVRMLEVAVPHVAGGETNRFFKALVR